MNIILNAIIYLFVFIGLLVIFTHPERRMLENYADEGKYYLGYNIIAIVTLLLFFIKLDIFLLFLLLFIMTIKYHQFNKMFKLDFKEYAKRLFDLT